MRYLLILALTVAGIAYMHRPGTGVRVVTHTVTVTHTNTMTIVRPHEGDPAPGSMSAREFDTIKVGQTAEYLDRMYGDSYANVPDDQQDVWPAEGGGFYVAHYDHKHDNRVVSTEWKAGL